MTTATKDDQNIDMPHASRKPAETGKPDHLKDEADRAESRQEALIDEGLEETFPASDSVSVKKIT